MGESRSLQSLVEPVVEALGFELWGLEHRRQGSGQLLRIYIDCEAGVTVDDCAAVSEQVGALLDVEDPLSGAYTLEVSSPGFDRPLFRPEHFRRSVGERVKLSLKLPREGRKRFTGVISTVQGDDVTLQTEDGELRLAFELIDRARIVPGG